MFTAQGNCQTLFALNYFFRELHCHPLPPTLLSLCRVSKFQKHSFGLKQLCAKALQRPRGCRPGAFQLLLPLWGSVLLAPSLEHLGISEYFKGSGEKVVYEGYPGQAGLAWWGCRVSFLQAEMPVIQDTFMKHVLCAEGRGQG